jgi:hypothetical protein
MPFSFGSGRYGVTDKAAVAKPCVPVDAAIFTTCGTLATCSGVTCTRPLVSDTSTVCVVASTGAEAQGPVLGQGASHAYDF